MLLEVIPSPNFALICLPPLLEQAPPLDSYVSRFHLPAHYLIFQDQCWKNPMNKYSHGFAHLHHAIPNLTPFEVS
jgi:hypothetical protein